MEDLLMLFNLLKKTKSVKELNNLFVVVFGILSWPEVYDKGNKAYLEQPNAKIYKFSDGIKEFCLNGENINSGISMGLYASKSVKNDAKSIVLYMKSVGCSIKSINTFKFSLDPKLNK